MGFWHDDPAIADGCVGALEVDLKPCLMPLEKAGVHISANPRYLLSRVEQVLSAEPAHRL